MALVPAILAATLLVSVLIGRHMPQPLTVRAYFSEVEELIVGSPIRVGGVEVGLVDSIRMTAEPRADGRGIEVVLNIQRDARSAIRTTSVASLRYEGLFGGRFVEIERGDDGDELSSGSVIPTSEIRQADLKGLLEVVVERMKSVERMKREDICKDQNP